MPDVSRRRALTAGAVATGAALGIGGSAAVRALPGDDDRAVPEVETGSGGGPSAQRSVPFRGRHQAGIATPVQDRMHTVAFDLVSRDRGVVESLLRAWTAAADRMTRGLGVGSGAIPAGGATTPDDTGEALGLAPARLTVTLGLGAGFFAALGLNDERPAALADLPSFSGERLETARSGGDLVVQACSDDAQVAVHAIRNLVRLGVGTVAVRWSQLGFGKTSSTTPTEATPRNLFGFKDGTDNLATTETDALEKHVWVDAKAEDAPKWLDGGTYMVTRRISMRIETWDRLSLGDQERLIGRTKEAGAPAGRTGERDPFVPADLPENSHVRLAHPASNDGHRILRRGYSFVDGSDGLGRLDAGLFFVAFCRDPRTQYIPLQAKLAASEGLAEYLVHTGSGLFVVPPGAAKGDYWAQALLEV